MKIQDYLNKEGFEKDNVTDPYLDKILHEFHSGRISEAEFYESLCMNYSEGICYYDLNKSKDTKAIRWILEKLTPQNPNEGFTLDIGAGTGLESVYLAEINQAKSTVVCLDNSKRMLDIARLRSKKRGIKNIRFVLGTRDFLPFCDDSFAYAMIINSLISTDELDQRDPEFSYRYIVLLRFKETKRILKSGGLVYLIFGYDKYDSDYGLEQHMHLLERAGFSKIKDTDVFSNPDNTDTNIVYICAEK